MCGIFAVINDQDHQAALTTLNALKRLEYRGYDSWGIAVISSEDQKVKIEKHIGKIGMAETSLPAGDIAIGHTRWATHGGVTNANAHPHSDCTGRLVVIHNGIVENFRELKTGLLKKKHLFRSETDTEVIAHLIEESLKKLPIQKAVFSVFKKLAGSNAIAVLDARSQTLVACRNGSPLSVGLGKGQYFLASDVTPFLKFTRDVIFLQDGQSVVMTKSGVSFYSLASENIQKPAVQQLDWQLEDAEKGGYSHYLLKEVMEQKITVPKTAVLNKEEITGLIPVIKKSSQIYLIGCGSASYCALAARYFFARQGLNAQSIGAYEFLPFINQVDNKSLVFAVSQSGETADTLIAAKAAKARGACLVAVVNARGSTLERMADTVLAVGSGPEIAVVSTKAFTSQLATLYLVSRAAAGKYDLGVSEIKRLGRSLSSWLTKKLLDRVIKLAKEVMNAEHMYVIGKHLSYPAALEFALKIKESSYIHAEPFAAGELKHGVITLIQKGTPCFAIGMGDETRLELLSSAAELSARGGIIIGIAPYASPEFKFHIKTPASGDLDIIPEIIVGQLLGYYLGIGRGADPDKPRNLAKSVTVK